jgi:branched-chain amino acid transport system substrate-binding protein
MTTHKTKRIARRTFLAGAAAGGAVIAAPAIAQTRTIKLGYVSPQTGPLAAFAEADNFTVAAFKEAMKGGLKVGSRTYPVDVIVKDSQSNPNRAAQVAKDANPGGGPPAWKPFNYVYHYFWGLEDVIAVFTNMWAQLDTNKVSARSSRTTPTAMPGATSRSASRRRSTSSATSCSIPAATRT